MKYKFILQATLVAMLAACSNSDQVATVGNKTIDAAQLDAYLKIKNIPTADVARRDAALDHLLEREALAQAIEASGKLDVHALEAELQEFRRQMLISRYFEQYLNDSVSDAAVQNFYAENIDRYQSAKVHVAHILFRVDPSMDETQRQAVLTKAQAAYSKLQSQVAFDELAREVSEDKVSGQKGGDLGWVAKGAIAAEFSERAFSAPVGEVSQPFLTDFGFHIIKVLEAPQVVKKPLEAVQGDIRYQLRNKAKAAEIERLQATVKISKGK